MRLVLVSAKAPDVIQHIHSFRESGVMSSQSARTIESDCNIFFTSSGNLCTVPPESFFAIITYSVQHEHGFRLCWIEGLTAVCLLFCQPLCPYADRDDKACYDKCKSKAQRGLAEAEGG